MDGWTERDRLSRRGFEFMTLPQRYEHSKKKKKKEYTPIQRKSLPVEIHRTTQLPAMRQRQPSDTGFLTPYHHLRLHFYRHYSLRK